MARTALGLLAVSLLVTAIGCSTPPTYYDYTSPVVTGGVPYNAPQPNVYQPGVIQPGTVQPGTVQPGVAQPGTQPMQMAPGMTTSLPSNYVGQPTPANPARMNPLPPATGGGAN
jgi:hypothetical protein